MPRITLSPKWGLHNTTYDKRRQAEGDYDDRLVWNISCVGKRRVGVVSWLVQDLCIRATERHLTDWKVVRLPACETHRHWINISRTLPRPAAAVVVY